MRKLILVPLLALALICLSGCGFSNPESLMHPPKPDDTYTGLYEALQSAAGADIKLKYPGGTESSRSAFLISKFELDSSLQAVACYRPSGEAAVTHLNFLKRQNGRWKSVYDLSGAGNDIELAEVVDFDADGVSELVTMWSLPNSSDKRLAVLRIGESGFTPIIEQDVRSIYLMDFDGDNSEELLQITLDAANHRASASLCRIQGGAPVSMGKVRLDGNVLGYTNFQEGTIGTGIRGLFFDAYKGAESLNSSQTMITEVLYYDGTLKNPFYDIESRGNRETYRPYAVNSTDLNLDGVVDIPTLTELPVILSQNEADPQYLITWKNFTGKYLEPVLYTVMNYTDGYYLILPEQAADYFTVQNERSSRTMTFFEYNGGSPGHVIFRVQVFSKQEWNSYSEDEYQKIGESEAYVYAASIGIYAPEGITLEAIQEHFRLID